jgi:NAD-dependent SIR2 family protein deacetylase
MQPAIALMLGAGASHHFTVPLTKDILPRIIANLDDHRLFVYRARVRSGVQSAGDDQKLLRKCLTALFPGLRSAGRSCILVTEVLSLLDYFIINTHLHSPLGSVEQLHRCRLLMEEAILDVLQGVVDPAVESTIPHGLRALGKWLFDKGKSSRVAIISTNYDEVVETEFYRRFTPDPRAKRAFDRVNAKVSFGLSWRDCPSGRVFHPPRDPRYSVFKLHGSVNWMRCDLCGWIVCNDDYNYTKIHSAEALWDRKNTCACGHWPLRPVIVAPSFVRAVPDTNILGIWKHAMEALRTANHWFVIGYSLPVEDVAIRAMLIRALASRKRSPAIEVFQLSDEATRRRYQALFGKSLKYHEDGMCGFLDRIVGYGKPRGSTGGG